MAETAVGHLGRSAIVAWRADGRIGFTVTLYWLGGWAKANIPPKRGCRNVWPCGPVPILVYASLCGDGDYALNARGPRWPCMARYGPVGARKLLPAGIRLNVGLGTVAADPKAVELRVFARSTHRIDSHWLTSSHLSRSIGHAGWAPAPGRNAWADSQR
jgi:hypothetical protein